MEPEPQRPEEERVGVRHGPESEAGREGPVRAPVDPDVLALLRKVGSSPLGKKYYLARGTALALQLHHRRSNDLDFFVDASALDRTALRRDVSVAIGVADTAVDEAGQVDVVVGANRRKISFIAYPFPSTHPKVTVEGQRCADLLEIAAMKAYTLGRPGAARDYVDMEAVVTKGGVSLGEIISAAKSRFVLDGESLFSERMFLQQIVYTEDLDDVDGLDLLGSSFGASLQSLRSIVAEHVERTIGGAGR